MDLEQVRSEYVDYAYEVVWTDDQGILRTEGRFQSLTRAQYRVDELKMWGCPATWRAVKK